MKAVGSTSLTTSSPITRACVRSRPAKAPCPSAATKARRRCSTTTSAPRIPCPCTGSSTARCSSCKCHCRSHGSCCSRRRTAARFSWSARPRHRRAYRRVGCLYQSGGVPTAALRGQAVGERPAGGAQRHDRRRQGGNGGDKQQGSRRRRRAGADLLDSSTQAAGGAKLVSLHIQIDKLTS